MNESEYDEVMNAIALDFKLIGENVNPERIKNSLRIEYKQGIISWISVSFKGFGLSSLPYSITEIKGLNELNLESYKLTSLPAWIAELKSLVRLWAENNKIVKVLEARNICTIVESVKYITVRIANLTHQEWMMKRMAIMKKGGSIAQNTMFREALGEKWTN